MFEAAKYFNGDLSSWDISKVTDMSVSSAFFIFVCFDLRLTIFILIYHEEYLLLYRECSNMLINSMAILAYGILQKWNGQK